LAPKPSLLEFLVPIKKPWLCNSHRFLLCNSPLRISATNPNKSSLLEFGVPIKKPYLRSRYRVLAM
jgi:hypothetical protein